MRGGSLLIGIVLLIGLAGCGAPEPPRLGVPGQKVTVVRGDRTYPMTAEILSWEVRPHPQVPERGSAVNFRYRFTGTPPEVLVELLACAIDANRVVILCAGIHHTGVGEEWFGPAEGLDFTRTTAVVVFPDQLHTSSNPNDPKDFDGYYPPRRLGPGDRI
ncbi:MULTISPECIES: hypothetical protein [unclassified Crossiella]|uniref:hypothetical protein n=1 Tax=unclassified Crossiella TaxID=2620835 RepID=UPI001FFF218D|nr:MULTISPECIES: hypothetical protein [unclassified Crossiella]MCK2238578.1 hypothetical protein [Crossiella sp. S99.2]MCK2251852.1 hypothetical protein [Crossiella sp. S99.1]